MKIKLYAGMTGEYEIIETDAPVDLIEKQLEINNQIENNNETIGNPYELLENNGYVVNLIASSDNDLDVEHDIALDYYDYNYNEM